VSSDWNRVREIVESALDLPAEERETFIRSSCGDDRDLVAEVMSWLRSAEQAAEQKFLAGPGAPPADEAPTPEDDPGELRVGSRIGDLTLTGELGAGQQGIVFEGRQRALNRRVAVKVLAPVRDPDATQTDRFLREAEAAARLHHPNVVMVHDILQHDGHHLIVQEYVEGRSLEEVLREREQRGGPVDGEACRRAATLCAQLARGLQHAHENKVVHRDVKPANVLVTKDDVPKVTDFGLAMMQDELGLTQTGTVLGTPHYMSPEQVEGRQQSVDARADVWSLGAILYRMLTGHLPFRARTLQALFRDILTRAPQDPSSAQQAVPRDLAAVCLKSLEKAPPDRYQSAGEFADDLERFLAGEATAARPLGPLGSANRALQRLATSTLAVVALLIPALWVALDLAWRPALGAGTPAVHDQRLAFLLGAALLTIWPVALLAHRLASGRRWATVGAGVLVLLLGAAGAAAIRGDRAELADILVERQHAQARDTLESQLSQPGVRGTDAIDAYVKQWADRIDTLDMQLIARGYLLAKRGPQAQEWADRAARDDPDNPMAIALAFAMADVFGSEDSARQAEARLWDSADAVPNWLIWMNVGEILRTTRHYGRAQRAYRIAQRDDGAKPHQLIPGLARISLALCQYEQAERDLSWTLDNLPRSPSIRLEAFRIACLASVGKKEWAAAAEYISRFESTPGASRIAALSLRNELLIAQGMTNEAMAALEDVASADDVSPADLEWCGKSADALVSKATSLEEYVDRLAFMEGCYEKLLTLNAGSVSGHVGIAAALLQQADVQPTPAAQVEKLERAEGHCLRAMELDDEFFEAHHSLSYSRRGLAKRKHGSYDEVPAAEWKSILTPLRLALQRDSLNYVVLNDMAQGLVYLHGQEPKAIHLEDSLEFIRRAIRLADAPAGSACSPWDYLDSMLDTQRDVNELRGEIPSALESARNALLTAQQLDPDDADRISRRKAHVDRLEKLLDAPAVAPKAGN
jgi:tetratricopeptide (TPR) repeat protein